jgi:hypothetical protein
MKITQSTIEGFIDEVVRAPQVYQSAVRMYVDTVPMQEECVSFAVVVVLTALVEDPPESEYLVICTLPCGVDYVHGERAASARVEEIKGKLSDLLPEHVAVRPGRLEE